MFVNWNMCVYPCWCQIDVRDARDTALGGHDFTKVFLICWKEVTYSLQAPLMKWTPCTSKVTSALKRCQFTLKSAWITRFRQVVYTYIQCIVFLRTTYFVTNMQPLSRSDPPWFASSTMESWQNMFILPFAPVLIKPTNPKMVHIQPPVFF